MAALKLLELTRPTTTSNGGDDSGTRALYTRTEI